MQAEHIPAYEYQRQRWKNGLGWTREVLREGADAERFDWRVSIAEIDQDCPFSAFPGYQRILVLLSGEGMRLRFDDDGSEHAVLPPHGLVRFDGRRSLHCQLIDGPTQDFNLMWAPDRVETLLHHRPLVGSMVFFAEPGSEWLIYLLSGWAQLKDGPQHPRLNAGDSLRLRPRDGGDRRALLEGAGEILCIKMTALPASTPSTP